MINMGKDIEKEEVLKEEKQEQKVKLTLEQHDKIYNYIYGIGEEYLKLLKERNKYRLRKIFKYEIDIDVENEINKVQLENHIEEKKEELKKNLMTFNQEENMGLIKEMIGYLYQSQYNELTYFTIETIVDIFLEKEIKIPRKDIEDIVSINEEKTEKEKINLAEGLLKLLYVTEDETEEEKKKLGFKYIKNTWFNRYLEYLAIKELKNIRNDIDLQYRKQAVDEIIASNSEYTKIYDLNGEKIVIGFVGYNIPKTIIENLNRILKEEILYFKNRNNIYTKKINMLYMERIICIIKIFETIKKVLEKSTNREQFLNNNINSNLKYNNISYVRITFIKKELDEKVKESLVRIFKDKEKIMQKILGFYNNEIETRLIKESLGKNSVENDRLLRKKNEKINAIASIKEKKKKIQNMKKKNDFEKILYANLLELEYLLLKKNNIIISKVTKDEKNERHLELEYKKNKYEKIEKEIDDIDYYEKNDNYDRITYILKDDGEEIGKIGENMISEQQIINRIDIYARIIENIINENRIKKLKGNTTIGILEKMNMIGTSVNGNENKKIAKLLEYIFSEETKIVNLSIKEKNKKLLEVIQKDGKPKTEQEIKKIKERYLKDNEKKRKRITYWDVEKFKLYKKAIEKKQ
jgi:hypothetical protein